MSYKEVLSDINRDGDVSLTQQIVDVFAAAIEAGDLGSGREAAADPRARRAGRRQPPDRGPRLPAGSPSSASSPRRVGSGTFVRGFGGCRRGPDGEARNGPSDPGWQHYALPERGRDALGSRRHRHVRPGRAGRRDDLMPFSVRLPGSDRSSRSSGSPRSTADVLENDGAGPSSTPRSRAPLELRDAIAEHMARRGARRGPGRDRQSPPAPARRSRSSPARSCAPATSSPASRRASSA